MSKFTVAGVSRNKGNVKVRFCSDLVLRVKNLQKQGDTDIQLVELPNPMTKAEACQYLIDNEQFISYVQDIIEVLGKKELKVNKNQPIIKAVEVETDPEMADIEAIAQLEAA